MSRSLWVAVASWAPEWSKQCLAHWWYLAWAVYLGLWQKGFSDPVSGWMADPLILGHIPVLYCQPSFHIFILEKLCSQLKIIPCLLIVSLVSVIFKYLHFFNSEQRLIKEMGLFSPLLWENVVHLDMNQGVCAQVNSLVHILLQTGGAFVSVPCHVICRSWDKCPSSFFNQGAPLWQGER